MRIDPRTFRKAIAQRKLYDRTINQCINYGLKEDYDLMGYAHVDYCLTSEDQVKLDFLDTFFCVLLGTLLLTTICSSYYDKTLQKTRGTPEQQKAHYKLPLEGSSECFRLGFQTVFSNKNFSLFQ